MKKTFYVLWMSFTISVIGDWISIVAISWYVYSVSESTLYLSLSLILNRLPTLILFRIISNVVSNYKKRDVLIVCSLFSCIVTFIIGIFVKESISNISVFLLLSFLMGVSSAFFTPALNTYVLEVVSNRKYLVKAVSLCESSHHIGRIVGTAISGIIFLNYDIFWCFFLDSMTYVVLFICLCFLHGGSSYNTEKHTQSSWSEIFNQIKYCSSNNNTNVAYALVFVSSIFFMNFDTILPELINEKSFSSDGIYSLCLTLIAIGSLLGSLTLARVKIKSISGKFRLQYMFLITSVTFALLSIVDGLVLFCSLFLIFGFINSYIFILYRSTIQLKISDSDQAVMMNYYNLVFVSGGLIGKLISGLSIEMFSVELFIYLTSSVMIFLFIVSRKTNEF